MATIFEEIIKGNIPCNKVFEDDRFIVIEDKFPQAPVHLLIIPKKHFERLHNLSFDDTSLISEAVRVAQHLADSLGISDGYRIVINNGPGAGQTVFHLHIHLLGGEKMGHDFA
ncbi:MAG: histidine triad nucleotide-binding protein [Victivallaceae bacterium]